MCGSASEVHWHSIVGSVNATVQSVLPPAPPGDLSPRPGSDGPDGLSCPRRAFRGGESSMKLVIKPLKTAPVQQSDDNR